MEADPDPTHSPVYLKIEGEVLSPLTSVPFGAPTKAPSFLSNCLLVILSNRLTDRHPYGPLLLLVQDKPLKRADPPQQGRRRGREPTANHTVQSSKKMSGLKSCGLTSPSETRQSLTTCGDGTPFFRQCCICCGYVSIARANALTPPAFTRNFSNTS